MTSTDADRRRLAALAVVVAAVLLGSLSGSGCSAEAQREEEERPPPRSRLDDHGRVVLDAAEIAALGLAARPATSGQVTVTRTRFGVVRARPGDTIDLVAPLPARVASVEAARGARVHEGDAVVHIEPFVDVLARTDRAARLAQVRGQLEAARSRLRAATVELRHVEALRRAGLGTATQRARARAEVAAQRARIASLTAVLAALRVGDDKAAVPAPCDGVVVRAPDSTGGSLSHGALVARVLCDGPRLVDVEVPPGEATAARYRVEACKRSLPATLVSRGAVADRGLRTDRLALGDAAPADCPVPGQVVRVELQRDVAGTVIPADALLQRGPAHLVFVEVSHGVYEPREVRVAARNAARVAVASGLEPGERVVVTGAAELLGELGFSSVARAPSDSHAEPTNEHAGEGAGE